MPESSAKLRDRAAHYRKLASLVTDDRLVVVIMQLAGELERSAKEIDQHKVVT